MQLVYQKKNLDLLKQGPRGIDGRLLYPASRGYINFFQFAVIVCLLGSSHRENVDSARKVDDYRNFPKLCAETRLECVWKNSRNAELRVFVLINAAQWSTWLSAWNLAFSAFISAIVCFMCENLQYESVYFKELHKNQSYYDRENTERGQL